MRPPRALLGTPNRWGAIDKADPEALIVQAQGRRPKSQSGGVGLEAGASEQKKGRPGNLPSWGLRRSQGSEADLEEPEDPKIQVLGRPGCRSNCS